MLTKMLKNKVWNLRAHLSCEHWLRDDADVLRGLLLALLRYTAYTTYRGLIRCVCGTASSSRSSNRATATHACAVKLVLNLVCVAKLILSLDDAHVCLCRRRPQVTLAGTSQVKQVKLGPLVLAQETNTLGQHTSAYVSTYVRIRQNTSAYVSIQVKKSKRIAQAVYCTPEVGFAVYSPAATGRGKSFGLAAGRQEFSLV